MTHEIEITGLNRVSQPRSNTRGDTILAYFDVKTNGFYLRGCALVRTSSKGLVAWPPNLEYGDKLKSIVIADDSLRHQIMEASRVVYRALGGTDAEWKS
ncbi:MAG: hypothetical protein ACOH2H_15090 [Cypionkella sp.]